MIKDKTEHKSKLANAQGFNINPQFRREDLTLQSYIQALTVISDPSLEIEFWSFYGFIAV